MSDIVGRLREVRNFGGGDNLCTIAADEIEHLRAERGELLAALKAMIEKPEIHSEDLRRARTAIAKAESKNG
jgi:hypothetical protein